MSLAGPVIVAPKQKAAVAKKLEPASTVVSKAKPYNDNRPDVVSQNKPAAIVRTAQPSRAMHATPEDNPKTSDRHLDRPEATRQ